MKDLNGVYRKEKALHELDCETAGFEWVDCGDTEQSVVGFLRRGKTTPDVILAVGNFTPVPRPGYKLGVPRSGYWRELLNSDGVEYGGSGIGNYGGVVASGERWRSFPATITLNLPPLAMVIFKSEG